MSKRKISFATPWVEDDEQRRAESGDGRTGMDAAGEEPGPSSSSSSSSRTRLESIERASSVELPYIDTTTWAVFLRGVDDETLVRLCLSSRKMLSVCSEYGDLRSRLYLKRASNAHDRIMRELERFGRSECFLFPHNDLWRARVSANARHVVDFFRTNVEPILSNSKSRFVPEQGLSSVERLPIDAGAPENLIRPGDAAVGSSTSAVLQLFRNVWSEFLSQGQQCFGECYAPGHISSMLLKEMFAVVSDLSSPSYISDQEVSALGFPLPPLSFFWSSLSSSSSLSAAAAAAALVPGRFRETTNEREKLLRSLIFYSAIFLEESARYNENENFSERAAILSQAFASADRTAWFWNSLPQIYPEIYASFLIAVSDRGVARRGFDREMLFLDYLLLPTLFCEHNDVYWRAWTTHPEFRPTLIAVHNMTKSGDERETTRGFSVPPHLVSNVDEYLSGGLP